MKQIEKIIHDVETLDYEEKLEVLERILKLMKNPGTEQRKRKYSLLDLEGLGKDVWEGIDPIDYIDQERNSWN